MSQIIVIYEKKELIFFSILGLRDDSIAEHANCK